jgi:drug/metabolite transporter (DMT)-like permease
MKTKTLLLALAAPICFGTGLTLAKPAVTHFPPLFMMLMAYSTVAIIMLLTVRERIKTPWPAMLLISSCAVTIQGALLFLGLHNLEATTANLVLQTQVPMAVFLGWLIGGEVLNARKIIGTAIALAGVAIVIGLPPQRPPLWPVALVITGAFVWALGQVLIQKFGQDNGIVLLKANSLYSVPQLALVSALFETGQWRAVQTAGPIEWATMAFVAVVGFYVAYMAWYSLLRAVRMDVAAPFILLMTPIGLLTAVVVLGEHMSLVQIIGATVLLFGLTIVNGLFSIRLKTA